MSIRVHIVVFVSAIALFAGCQSYTIVQRNVFADDYGHVVQVSYGHSSSDHVNTFISPVTGKEMEFKSRLMIKATLPDGDTIKAWQCMNFRSNGTMYRTDNDEWMVLAGGFSCIVYHQTDEDETRYLEVFRGVLCDTPETEVKKDDRWRELPRSNGSTYRQGERKR